MESRVEEYIKAHTRNCSNEFEPQKAPPSVYNPWLTPDHAREAAKIAREEVVEKMSSWLKKHAIKYYINSKGFLGTDELVEALKKELED